LRDDVGQRLAGLEAPAEQQADRDGGIEVAAGDVPKGVGHRQNGQADGQSHSEQSDPDAGELRGQHCAATATRDQSERADELRCQPVDQPHECSQRAKNMPPQQ